MRTAANIITRIWGNKAMSKILIVEDDHEMREFLRDVVEMMGHEPFEASTGAEAIALVAQQVPDLVLQDIMLPDIDGWETLARLRVMHGLDGLPVVFCSGSVKACEHFNADPILNASFLNKPFDIDDLEREINKLLDQLSPRNQPHGTWSGMCI